MKDNILLMNEQTGNFRTIDAEKCTLGFRGVFWFCFFPPFFDLAARFACVYSVCKV